MKAFLEDEKYQQLLGIFDLYSRNPNLTLHLQERAFDFVRFGGGTSEEFRGCDAIRFARYGLVLNFAKNCDFSFVDPKAFAELYEERVDMECDEFFVRARVSAPKELLYIFHEYSALVIESLAIAYGFADYIQSLESMELEFYHMRRALELQVSVKTLIDSVAVAA